MQSSTTAGSVYPSLSSMLQIQQMAELLAQSKLVPEAMRNPADCFGACLIAAAQGVNPMDLLTASSASEATPPPSEFGSLALKLANASTALQLRKIEIEMDDSRNMSDEEATAILTIYNHRSDAIKSNAGRVV